MSSDKFKMSAKAGAIDMQLAYLDANATIYFVEKVAPYYAGIRQRMTDASGKPVVRCAISELLLMEVRVKPMREQDQAALTLYEAHFSTFGSQIIDLDKAVFTLATELRVRHRVKTPDALHLAAAIHAGCDQFWTHDIKLAKAAENRIAVVDIGAPHDPNT